ncbi:MAG: hypothetical protein A2639_00580 [Candidatus Staskawiczbacteria bacterium RIFCSPHIGHO2_01_FULL_34_27]|uniref:NAD-dependent epimerase/dehydratase domain-containing protein n=1 Tax=Candidatus Staskawiczbacteria bacterium RIFCSPHIGHO2_01_FULL_34_27 TaxID=1802199 RepID=A0A1G2HL67_9BACT|nr:MAG: hypothetical protein A2639_00580 [Candidatus Staskawiczbacteria bacterium RIFCSPHIGHO2_01_FULL_34_27]
MKKYLIIGGAGFIGSHLSKALLAKGNKVAVIDIAAKSVDAGAVHYLVDVQHAKSVAAVFKKEKPDFVFHLAGAINLRREITDPLFIKDMDFLLRAKIILDACKKYNVKKIIFISSGGSVYENAKEVPTPEEYLAHPASLYGLANLMIEKYIDLYCKSNGINFTIPRVSNAYGPRQWQSGLIPASISKMSCGIKPVLFGNGGQTRDFIYIDDVVDALILLAQKGPGRKATEDPRQSRDKNEVYNVASGKEIDLKKIIELIGQSLGADIKPEYKNSKNAGTEKSALDIKKIQKELGWSPKTDIKTGILKVIEWYKKI